MDNFFGIKPDTLSKREIILFVDNILGSHNGKKTIVTLNPEILLKAQKEENYKKIINDFDLKIVDGFGIKLAGFLKGIKTGERVAGADLAEYILKKSEELGLKTGLVMKRGGLSEKKDLRFAIYDLGIKNCSIVETDLQKLSSWKIQKLSSGMTNIEVLLVGLGAPDQEQFIYQAKDFFPNLKLAIGVGGTFDYWTGKKKRSPVFMRKIGLEWLWRLIIQPNRFFRIWNATAVFMYKVLKN